MVRLSGDDVDVRFYCAEVAPEGFEREHGMGFHVVVNYAPAVPYMYPRFASEETIALRREAAKRQQEDGRIQRHFAYVEGEGWLERVRDGEYEEWEEVDSSEEDTELGLAALHATWQSLAWTLNH